MNIKDVLQEIYTAKIPSVEYLLYVLNDHDQTGTQALFGFADTVRREYAGEGILLRGIVEFSNYCSRGCAYCGLNCGNLELKRYRLDREQVLTAAGNIARQGIKTIVLQAGEDPVLGTEWLAEIISVIKDKYALAVTLSVGERSRADYARWREAGADRYLLKLETTDKELYQRLHPEMSFADRLRCLQVLKDLGYQVGSGNIVGLPGQTLEMLAADIIFFKENELDMIGIGPFIPHAGTPLAAANVGEPMLTLKVLALARMVNRTAHLPATTALGSLDRDYRPDGLQAGANVLMPNFTPAPYKELYELYPGKRCIQETGDQCVPCLEKMVSTLGRTLNRSRGDGPSVLKQRAQAPAEKVLI
jgi:biotin synthase